MTQTPFNARLGLSVGTTPTNVIDANGAITLPASQGLAIGDGAPSTTTNKLYQIGSSLYFNGSQVSGSGFASRNINGVAFDDTADITVPVNSTNDNATATTCYPVWVTAAGNSAANIAASSFTFVPSTGVLGITTIHATGDITAYYSSDKRLKRNIKPIENPIEKLKQINGVTFDWSEEYLNQRGGEDGFFVRKHDIGFIAQEVQAVLPEIVGERKDHFLGLKYDRMTVLLAEAVKEQQVQIEAQQAQIERLLAALGMK